MARNEQLIRQHRILQILERYRFGRTLPEIRDDLVDELGLTSLHERSVRRDLEALQAAGIDLDQHETGRGKVWKLGPGVKGTHKIAASATELIALSLSRDLLYPLAGTPFWIGIESFWNKIREELPSAVWEHYERHRRALFVLGMPAKSYDKHHGMLSTLNRSILEHRVVEAVYQSAGQSPRTRRIEPLGVVLYERSLYIVAADHERPVAGGAAETSRPADNRIRYWKLDRFKKTTALDLWFKPPTDFDLRDYLGKHPGIFSGGAACTFVVRLTSRGASWAAEEPWHPRQQTEPLADGGAQLTIPDAHEMDVVPRVLAFGGEAELLAPEAARRKLAAQLAAMAAAHARKSAER